MEIGVNEIKLLEISAKEIIKEIASNKRATAVKVKAFQLLLDNGKEVQIQVMVESEKNGFLDDFQLEMMVK